MSLTEIALPDASVLGALEVGADVERFVQEAERRIDAFYERTLDEPRPAFVPSDFRAAYRALTWIRSQGLAAGNSFCEWGSGFGVVAMLAYLQGFCACGIEVDPELLAESVALAADHAFDVEFVAESFVPHGSEEQGECHAFEEADGMAWIDYGAPPAYEALGSDPEDFDVIFAYPWPGEHHVILDLFDRHASAGALLLTYHGAEGMRLHRRDRASRSRRRSERRPR